MSQNGEEAKAQSNAQNLNKSFTITYFHCKSSICVVSIVSPDGKTRILGNGNGIIVPDNHITRKGSKDTLESERKQYRICFEKMFGHMINLEKLKTKNSFIQIIPCPSPIRIDHFTRINISFF